MRVFIQCVDSYCGKAVMRELRRHDGVFHRLFASLKDPKTPKPKIVKRLVHRQDEKPRLKYAETILSCKLIVLNLHADELDEIDFVLDTLKKASSNGEIEQPIRLVLISSLFVWSSANKAKAEDYETQREPRLPLLKKWKEYEDKVLAFNGIEEGQIKSHVIGAGAFYGNGECHYFSSVYRDAWHGKKICLPSASRRKNRVPTIHVTDMARCIKSLAYTMVDLEKGERPYIIACDKAQNTLQELWQGVVDEMTTPYKISTEPPEGTDDATDPVGVSDLTFECSDILLDENFNWESENGLKQTIRSNGLEFAIKNNLQAVKVLLLRKPESVPSKQKAQDKIMSKYKSFLEEELGIKCIKSSKELESTNTIRYRGYILDELLPYEKCMEIFTETRVEEIDNGPNTKENRDEEGGNGEGDESPGGEESSPANKQIETVTRVDLLPSIPEHVIVVSHGGDTETNEANDNVAKCVAFFREMTDVEPFYLIPPTSDDVDNQLQAMRIYLDGMNRRPDGTRGRPLSDDIKTETDCLEETRTKHRELERKFEEEGAGSKLNDAADLNEIRTKDTKMERKRWDRLVEIEEDEERLKEMTIHDYITAYVTPDLNEGLISLCSLKPPPDEPIEYLAAFLEGRMSASAGGGVN